MMLGDEADADGNGVISQAEWTAATPSLFAHMDRNGDGVLAREDFRRRG